MQKGRNAGRPKGEKAAFQPSSLKPSCLARFFGSPGQPGARAVGFRGDGDGDPLVPALYDSARRISRRVLAAPVGDPDRHRCGIAVVGAPAPPHDPTGAVVHGGAGPVRGVHASRAGPRRCERRGARLIADREYQAAAGRAVETVLSAESAWVRLFTELWFNARPILSEVAVPALLMGFSFPLANAIIQRAEPSVGRRAGLSVSVQHRRRSVRLSGRRVRAASDARDPGQRHGVDDRGRSRRGAALSRRARIRRLRGRRDAGSRGARGLGDHRRRCAWPVALAALGLCDCPCPGAPGRRAAGGAAAKASPRSSR